MVVLRQVRHRDLAPTPRAVYPNAKYAKAFLGILGYNSRFTTKRAGIYRPFFLADCFLMPPANWVASPH